MEAVTLRAARSFRRWTLLLLCLTLLSPILFWWLQDTGPRPRPTSGIPFLDQMPRWPGLLELIRNGWFFGTSLISLCLWIITATGISGCFFQSRRFTPAQAKRSAALSCYATAPLAWMTPSLLAAALFLGMEVSYERIPWIFYPCATAFGTTLVLCALCPVAYWWTVLRVLRKVTGSRRRMFIAAPLLPILWATSAGLIFLALQFAVNYVALFLGSIR